MILWHNPRCATSRKALELLENHGTAPRVRLYLTDPPTRAELAALGLPASALMRWKNAPDLPRDLPDAAILDRLAAEPALIERPILIVDGRAAIGRPPEALLALIEAGAEGP